MPLIPTWYLMATEVMFVSYQAVKDHQGETMPIFFHCCIVSASPIVGILLDQISYKAVYLQVIRNTSFFNFKD